MRVKITTGSPKSVILWTSQRRKSRLMKVAGPTMKQSISQILDLNSTCQRKINNLRFPKANQSSQRKKSRQFQVKSKLRPKIKAGKAQKRSSSLSLILMKVTRHPRLTQLTCPTLNMPKSVIHAVSAAKTAMRCMKLMEKRLLCKTTCALEFATR